MEAIEHAEWILKELETEEGLKLGGKKLHDVRWELIQRFLKGYKHAMEGTMVQLCPQCHGKKRHG